MDPFVAESHGSSMAAIAAYLATATLAAGTITTSQPMTLTQTWNAAGVTFTTLVVNPSGTGAAASLIADFQFGSASKLTINTAGNIAFKTAGTSSAPNIGTGATGFANVLVLGGSEVHFSLSSGVWDAILSSGQFVLQHGNALAFSPDSGGADLFLSRDAANILAQKNSNADQTQRWYSTNAAYSQIQSLSESTTLSGATTDTAIQFPANCIPLGVTVRVTTLIAGATTFNVGDAASATRYGTGIAVAANTTNAQAGTTNPVIPSAGTKVRFTAVGGAASFSAGVVRVTLHYISLSAPTS